MEDKVEEKKKLGRPRTRPIPDPNAPKKPRGRKPGTKLGPPRLYDKRYTKTKIDVARFTELLEKEKQYKELEEKYNNLVNSL